MTSNRRNYAWCMCATLMALLAVLVAHPAFARVVVVSPQNAIQPMLPNMDVLEDKTGDFAIQDVTSPTLAQQFKPNTRERNQFGFKKGQFWFRFTLENQTEEKFALLLLGKFKPDDAHLYYKENNGRWVAWETRPHLIKGLTDALKVPLPGFGSSRDYMLRIPARPRPLILSLDLLTPKGLMQTTQRQMMGSGLFFGALGLVFLVGLVMAASLRSMVFLTFSMFVLSHSALLAVDIGLNKIVLKYGPWHEMAIWVSMMFIQIFSWFFLQLKHYRRLSKVVLGMAAACFILTVISYYTDGRWKPMHQFDLIPLMFLSTIIIMPWAALKRYRDGFHPALIFLWSWPPLFFGVVMHIAFNDISVPPLFILEYGLQIGAMLQVILGCIALADMLRVQRNQAQQKLLAVEKETAIRLEKEVEERTRELAQANEMLSASETNYRNVCERASDGIAVVLDQRILYVNPQLAAMLGFSAEEVIGASFTDFVVPEQREKLVERHDLRLDFNTAPEKAPASQYEAKLLSSDKASLVEVEVNAGLTEYEGTPAILAIIRDITERNRMLKELENAKEAADSANQAKSIFLANMSHEIRTPMSAIIGLSHLALQTKMNIQQKDYLLKIDKSANSLLRLLNDILDLSKIEAGKLELEIQPFLLRETLESLKSIIGFRAQEKGVNFSLHLDESIPTWLSGDSFRLEQVLLNLTTNAVKFTLKGEVSVAVTLESETDDNVVLACSVRDTGIGMSPEQLSRLFQPFQQAAPSTSRTYGGTGLGLVISKHLVDLMGGELSAQSEQGKGSAFRFTAMFNKTDESANVSPSSFAQDLVSKHLAGRRVLLVEDSEVNLQVARELLEQVGVTVKLARNGQEAVEMASTEKLDLVFMDLHMPVMDGLAASRTIRERLSSQELPIVAMTANAMEEDRRRCMEAGMDGYLPKPFKPHNLYHAIMEQLGEKTPAPPTTDDERVGEGEYPLPDVDNLNVQQGLAHVGDNDALYLKALKRALKEHRGAANALKERMRLGDTDGAIRLAHTLKGVAGTIGASLLKKTAEALENELAPTLTPRTEELMTTLTAELDQLMAGLDQFFQEYEQAPPPAEAHRSPAPPIDGAALAPLLRDLAQSIDEGDANSMEYVAGLKEMTGAGRHSETVQSLEKQIDDYDFDGAKLTLQALMEEMLGNDGGKV